MVHWHYKIHRSCFLALQDGSLFNRVFKTYKTMHTNQTVDFVKEKVRTSGAHTETIICSFFFIHTYFVSAVFVTNLPLISLYQIFFNITEQKLSSGWKVWKEKLRILFVCQSQKTTKLPLSQLGVLRHERKVYPVVILLPLRSTLNGPTATTLRWE